MSKVFQEAQDAKDAILVFAEKERDFESSKCIGCDGKRGNTSKCGGTLCLDCWLDAEGE